MAWWNNPTPAGMVGAAAGGPVGYVAGQVIPKWLKDANVPKAPGYDVDESAFEDPYHDANADRFWGGADAAANRTGNQQFRQGQADLIGTLQSTIAGNAPSVAENQLRAGGNRALAGAKSLAASATGATNPALAMRAIDNAHANIAQSTARDAATLRAGEIAQARGELGNVLASARGGDLTQQGMNDSLVSKYLDLGYSNDQAAAAAAREREQLKAGVALGTQQLNAGIAAGNRDWWTNLAGSTMGAAGAVGSMVASDERTKKDVQPGGDEIRKFLDDIAARGFEYKKPNDREKLSGRHVGVMAQDLEVAGPVGRGMVRSAPDGTKMVDAGQAAGAALAASADINERLKRLEGGQDHPPRPSASAPSAPPRYNRNDTPGRRMIRWITGQPAESAISAGSGG